MRISPLKLARYLLILSLSMMVFGCAPAQPAANANLIWAVGLSKYEVKNKLQIVETVKQYNGSYDEVHQQTPTDGHVYLIMNVSIKKQGSDPVPFDWSKLTVQDGAGNSYARMSNDTFLEQYKYTPRMTGLEIKFGENAGWLCYEIPTQAADGKLALTYNAKGSQQEVVIK